MGVVSYFLLSIFDNIFNLTTTLGIFSQGFFSGIIGIGCGVLVLYLMKNSELQDLFETLNHKFWKSRVVAPEQKEL